MLINIGLCVLAALIIATMIAQYVILHVYVTPETLPLLILLGFVFFLWRVSKSI
jgi:uncharacterized membrane protein YqjE